MEQLPMLYKRIGYSYFIEVQNEVFSGRDGDMEMFSYAIYCRTRSGSILEKEGSIINRRLKRGQSPFDSYCNRLASFYGCKVKHIITQH